MNLSYYTYLRAQTSVLQCNFTSSTSPEESVLTVGGSGLHSFIDILSRIQLEILTTGPGEGAWIAIHLFTPSSTSQHTRRSQTASREKITASKNKITAYSQGEHQHTSSIGMAKCIVRCACTHIMKLIDFIPDEHFRSVCQAQACYNLKDF